MKKRTFLLTIGCATTCFLLLATFGQGYFFDEKPDSGRDEFYKSPKLLIPDQNNLAVAMSGIMAPLGTDNNIRNTKQELSFSNPSEEHIIDCSKSSAIKLKQTCITQAAVELLLLQNKVLLDRYHSLYKITSSYGYASDGGQIILDINQLISAQTELLISQDKNEEAYQLWKKNHQFISRVLAQDSTMISKAIFLVIDDINLSSLENLLFKKPAVIKEHANELHKLLQPRSLSRYNIKGMLRQEYHFYNTYLFKQVDLKDGAHPEFLRNRLYQAHVRFLRLSTLTPKEMTIQGRKLQKEYSSLLPFKLLLPHGVNNTVSSMTNNSLYKGLNLVNSMHSKSALLNLLDLEVYIQQEKINQNELIKFLSSRDKTYNCPFTQTHMAYDSAKNTIYCNNPQLNKRTAEVRLGNFIP